MRTMTAQSIATMAKRRNFVNYAVMTLADGTVLNLKPEDFRVSGNSFTDNLVNGDDFQFGTVVGKTVNIRLDNTDERFSQYNFYMATFMLYLHLPDAYIDANDDPQDEIITLGYFTVTQPTTSGVVIDIAGVDEIYKFDRSFDDCTYDLTASHTLKQILTRCCNDCGVAIGFTDFDNANLSVQLEEQPKSKTYREIVSQICTMAGANGKVNATGAFVLTWYDSTVFEAGLDGGTFSHPGTTSYQDGDVADGGSFNPWNTGYVIDSGQFSDRKNFHIISSLNNLTINTDDTVFTGVKIKNGDNITYYPATGYEGYLLEIADNPFTIGREATIATQLYNKLQGLLIRGFTCTIPQNPMIEAGDACMIWDIKNNPHKTLITNVTYTVGGSMTISCNAKNALQAQTTYSDKVAQAITESKSYSDKRLDTYGNAVAHFNELANAALGYYRTDVVEQGATITYIHDKPTLQASDVIWKITAGGIFISEDGGQTYTSGVDTVNAELIMNMVYAVGINCDWIHSGTLTLGGNNNINGKLEIQDSSGTVIGTWDNTGLTVYRGALRGLSLDLGGTSGTYGALRLYDNQNKVYAEMSTDGVLIKSGDMRIGYKGILVTDLKYGEDWSAYNEQGHGWAQFDYDSLEFKNRGTPEDPVFNTRVAKIYLEDDDLTLASDGGITFKNITTTNAVKFTRMISGVDTLMCSIDSSNAGICIRPDITNDRNLYIRGGTDPSSTYFNFSSAGIGMGAGSGSSSISVLSNGINISSDGGVSIFAGDYTEDVFISADHIYLRGEVHTNNGITQTVIYRGQDGGYYRMEFEDGILTSHSSE